MADYESGIVACPFYIRGDRKSVLCEGFADGVKNRLEFGREKDKKAHVRRFCADVDGFDRCPAAQLAAKKYEK